MKKALKITGIILGVILISMICIPLFFSGKIEALVKKEANKMIDAEFDFASLDISLFKNFPKASLSLKDFWVKGQGAFSDDTLAFAKELTATVDILSLFQDNGFEIDQIQLKDALINAKVLADGQENWDIFKEDNSNSEPERVSSDGKDDDFSLNLKKLVVSNLSLTYDNKKEGQYASIDKLSIELQGNLASQQTKLIITGKTPQLSFRSGGIPLLNTIELDFKINLDADLANQIFTFEKNEIQLNAIKTNLDGWIALKEDDKTEMDLKLNTNDVGFKEILSLIPAIYSKDFKNIKTEGIASLKAYATGILHEDNLPSFELTLQVKDALFQYPSLPSSVDQIQVHATLTNPGGKPDLTVLQIKPFSFRMANNPFSLTATVSHPISDPHFDLKAKGLLDLSKIQEVYPLEDTKLNGLLDANIAIAGQASFIEKERYEKISSSGTIKLTDMSMEAENLPKLRIDQSLFTFTPQFLKLSETTIHLGENDLTLDSQLNNYLGYIMKGSTIQGSLNLHSNYLNLNDWSDKPQEPVSETPTDSVFGVIEVPRNIDFNINAKLKNVVLGTLTLKDVQGLIHVKDGKADMTNLSMKTMGGEVLMNGYYTTQQIEHPIVNASFTLNNLTFSEAYKELNMVQTLAPVFNSLEGSFTGNMLINTELNESMEPVYPSLQATGSLQTQNLSLSKVEVLQQLAKALKQEQLIDRPIKDIDLNFEIKDGRVKTTPFDFNMGEYNLNLAGTTGLDQTIDYTGKLTLPSSVTKTESFNTLGFLIEGSFKNPTFKIDTKGMLKEGSKKIEDKASELIKKELLKHKKDSTAVNDTIKKDIKEQVKDAATDKLKDLFKKKKNK